MSRRILGILLPVFTMLLFAVPELQAQVYFGFHGAFNDGVLETGTWGVGGRLGVELVSLDSTELLFDVGANLYFPDCEDQAECDLYDLQGNLLLMFNTNSNNFLPYVGAGWTFQDFSAEAESSEAFLDGNDNGLSLILGTAMPFFRFRRPFIEIRRTIMDDFEDQTIISLGIVL